ncbi:MAG: R3H domain-containing nucleic acid-binding protein [Patescibacteria group bacterium]
MLNTTDLSKVKKEAEEFFRKMNFEVEISYPPQKDETVFIEVKTQEPQILIGEGGQTLNEIQHLLKAILRKKIIDPFFIDLDISDYKKKKADYLREMARSVADEVALGKQEKTLLPMSAYERRIVHMELADRSDVITESIGEDPERKIIIKPRP